jgi:hypothetical protein
MNNVQNLRAHAIARTLFPPTALKKAIEKMGFVQADPIRAPAAAQDLILRHRVKDYRAGDLERQYPILNIEEDMLYAYGFLARPVWQLIHPRIVTGLTKLEKDILASLRQAGEMHPRDLAADFGSKRTINAWGGHSKETTRALEDLHYRGLLRIVRREKGIKVYQPSPPISGDATPVDRTRGLIMVVANILAPVSERSLLETVGRIRHSVPKLTGGTRAVVRELLKAGQLKSITVDGINYLCLQKKGKDSEIAREVRFLAPFDPLVWDRRRFEHLWGWSYRFEAYTPPAKRLRGYYAMPMLWGDDVIGWANASVVKGTLIVETGFVQKRPKEAAFREQLSAEIDRLNSFLDLARTGSQGTAQRNVR